MATNTKQFSCENKSYSETDEVYTGNNCNYPWQSIPAKFLLTAARQAQKEAE